MLVYLQSQFNPCETWNNWGLLTEVLVTKDRQALHCSAETVTCFLHTWWWLYLEGHTKSDAILLCPQQKEWWKGHRRCPVRTCFLWAEGWLLSAQDGAQLTISSFRSSESEIWGHKIQASLPSFLWITGWCWMSQSLLFLGYQQTLNYKPWLFVNTSLNPCVVREEGRSGGKEKERDQEKQWRQKG